MTVSLPRLALRRRGRGSGAPARGASARVHGRRDGGAALFLVSSAAGCGLRARRRRLRRRARFFLGAGGACSAAASSALRFSSARRRSSSLCATLARSSRRRASSSGVRRASSASRCSAPAAPCARKCRRLRTAARLRRGGSGRLRRRLGRFGDGFGLGASAGGRFARPAEDAALLDLDHDRVRAAVAEALLDLAGLDRALEAQRRPGAKLRFFGLVCHSIPSSNLLQPSRSPRRVLRLQDHDRGQ